MLTATVLCGLMLHLWPAAVCARELANVDSPTWCAQHAPAAQSQCLRRESACRAALPDMNSAGGCPSRELEACVARQENGGSWCSILRCIDPDHPACRAATAGMPPAFSPPGR
ncbi:MAG: hypothetical protein F8N36_04820 [Desulfovibrio sp.]|nr:hypothetical protein [Desulfovibrio sp.]